MKADGLRREGVMEFGYVVGVAEVKGGGFDIRLRRCRYSDGVPTIIL